MVVAHFQGLPVENKTIKKKEDAYECLEWDSNQ
jgi:hypothetical protein